MPYVSPKGVVKATAPPRRSSSVPIIVQDDNAEMDAAITHIASKELGEVLEGRDADPEIVAIMDGMDHWNGWSSPPSHPDHVDGVGTCTDNDRGCELDPLQNCKEASVDIAQVDPVVNEEPQVTIVAIRPKVEPAAKVETGIPRSRLGTARAKLQGKPRLSVSTEEESVSNFRSDSIFDELGVF